MVSGAERVIDSHRGKQTQGECGVGPLILFCPVSLNAHYFSPLSESFSWVVPAQNAGE